VAPLQPPRPVLPGAGTEPRLWRTVLRLMAARWRIAYNSFLRGARWRQATYVVVLLALAFIALVALLVSYVMTVAIVELTGSLEAADVVASSAISGALLLCVVVSFTVALAALYLSRDLDMLLTAPIPSRAVFFSKLFGGLLPTNLLVLTLALVPLIGYGLGMRRYTSGGEFGWPFAAAVALALLLLPLLPMVIGSLTVMVVVRRVSARRLGEVVGLLVVAMTLTIALVAGSARQLQQALTFRDLLDLLNRVRAPWSPAEWLTRAVAHAGREEWGPAATWFLLIIGLAAVGFALLYWASDRLYYEGWLHMQSTDRRHEPGGSRMPWSRVDRAETLSRPSALLAWLPAPTVAVMRKDLRVIPRDLTNMAQVLSPLAIGIFFVLQQLLYPVRVGGADRLQPFTTPLLSMLSAAVATGVSAMIMARFGLTAFSSEGRSYWVLKGSPVSAPQLLSAKFLVGYLPFLALGFGLIVLLNGARAASDASLVGGPWLQGMLSQLRPDMIAYGCLVLAVLGTGILSITLALGTARPNLTWDTPHEMLTPDVGCLSLVLYGSYIGIAGIALGLPAAVSGFPILAGETWLWALGGFVGLGVTAVVVAGSFWLASAELAAVGE
jgi:ABC-2 type transport system permease protein